MITGTWFVSWSKTIGIQCPDPSGGTYSPDACFNSSAFVRTSWSLMWFNFLIFLICLVRNDCAAMIHDGWWTLKFLIVAALFIGSLYIPNTPVMIGYMQFSRAVSVIFLAYQAILMLIVAYVINAALVNKVNEGNNCAKYFLILLFLILTGGNITWIVY